MAKKNKVEIGDMFTVPLGNNLSTIGLIGKLSKLFFIGYFFDITFPSDKWENIKLDFNKEEVVIYKQLSTSILKDGLWPIIAKGKCKSITDDPIPLFRHYDSLRKTNYIIEYNEDLSEADRYPSNLPVNEWEKLSGAGLAGSIFMEKVLENLLVKKVNKI